jgi:hypothetical protein
MIGPEPPLAGAVRDTGTAMPRARAQSSLGPKKLSRDSRIDAEMQTSTPFPMAIEGFAAVQANREFDLWLQRELCRLHGDILHEPVPDKLLQVLEEALAPHD